MIDCNTFWSISGTTKNVRKSGSWAPVLITKIFQTIQENMWTSLHNIIFISENMFFWFLPRHRFRLFVLFVYVSLFAFVLFRCCFCWYLISNCILRIWWSENDNIYINKISKNLDRIFWSIKKHEMEMWYILQTFLFSRKGII